MAGCHAVDTYARSNGEHETPLFGVESSQPVEDERTADTELLRAQPEPSRRTAEQRHRRSDPNWSSPDTLEQALHLHHVEPAAELPADLAFGAHELEPARGVQRDRRVVAPGDPRDHRVEAVRLRRGGAARRGPSARCRGPGSRRAGTPSSRPWWSRPAAAGTATTTRSPPRARRRPRPGRRRPRPDAHRSARRSTAPARRGCAGPCRRARSTR